MCSINIISSASIMLKPSVHINRKKFKIMKEIGEGGFAFVYQVSAKDRKSVNHYALKKIICESDEQYLEAMTELNMLSTLQSKNSLHILRLVDSSVTINSRHQKIIHILTELCTCSIQNIIDRGCKVYNGACLSFGYPHCPFFDGLDAIMILRQISEALYVLHDSGYQHGDLKPANILLRENFQAVLSDFGSVIALPHRISSRNEAACMEETAARLSTAPYRAPELFHTPSQFVFDGKADVWSFGCTMYAIMFSRSPFESPLEGFSKLSAVCGTFSFPSSNPWPSDYLQLVSSCLQVDVTQRPSVCELRVRLKRLSSPPLDLHRCPCPSPCPSSGTDRDRESSMSSSSFSFRNPSTEDPAGLRLDSSLAEASNINLGEEFADFTFMEIPVPSPRPANLTELAFEEAQNSESSSFHSLSESFGASDSVRSSASLETSERAVIKSEHVTMLREGRTEGDAGRGLEDGFQQAKMTLTRGSVILSIGNTGHALHVFSLRKALSITALESTLKGQFLAVLAGSCPDRIESNNHLKGESAADRCDWETVEHADILSLEVENYHAFIQSQLASEEQEAKRISPTFFEHYVDVQCTVDFGSRDSMADWAEAIAKQQEQLYSINYI